MADDSGTNWFELAPAVVLIAAILAAVIYRRMFGSGNGSSSWDVDSSDGNGGGGNGD